MLPDALLKKMRINCLLKLKFGWYILLMKFDEISRVEKLSDLRNCKKLTGHQAAYRIKLNHYRIGFYFQNNTVELVRVLDRKNIYKFFPLKD